MYSFGMYLSSSFTGSNVQFSSALSSSLSSCVRSRLRTLVSLPLRLDRSTKRAPRFELPCCGKRLANVSTLTSRSLSSSVSLIPLRTHQRSLTRYNTTIEEVANKFEGSIRTGRGRYIQTSMKTSTPRHIARGSARPVLD